MHRQYPRYRMRTKPFSEWGQTFYVFHILKMSLEKTIETYNKK
jgi:hypothetical protein